MVGPQRSLLLFLLFSGTLVAQEFTEPDSAAIVRNHVKQVTISWTNDKGDSYPTRTYRYNRSGQMIYSAEGSPSYYYSYRYDSAGRMCWSDQRKMDGTLIAGYGFVRYPNGKFRFVSYFNEYDTVHATKIDEYDESDNIVEARYFKSGILAQLVRRRYENKIPVWSYDSSATDIVIRNGNRIERWTMIDTVQHKRYDWSYFYNDKDMLTRTVKHSKDVSDTTDIHYAANGLYTITVNGKPATPAEDKAWRDKCDYLIPKKLWQEDRMPYSDPVPEEKWNHQLIRDRKGNITKDIITTGYEWMRKETSVYTYKYEFW
jgi:hypothetical protein